MTFMLLFSFVSILVGMSKHVTPAEISFPDHVTIDMKGGNAFFQCSLTLSSDESVTSHGIRWTRNDNTEIASSDSLADSSGKYALSLRSTDTSLSISQTMLISSIDETDLGTYQCIFLLNNQETNDKASARLYIQDYVPSPVCWSPTKTIHPNDQIMLQCDSDPGDPAIQISWSPEAGGSSLANYNQNSNNQLILNYLLTVPNNAEGVISYSCKTSNNTNQLGNVKSCNISLLVVVKLLISQSPEIAIVGQDVMFICYVLSDGSTSSSISWSFQSSGIVHTIMDSTLTINYVQSRYDGLILTCVVDTSDGQQITKRAILYLTSPATTPAQKTTIMNTVTHSPLQTSKMITTALKTTRVIDAKITTPPQSTLTSQNEITVSSHKTTDALADQTVSPSNKKDDESLPGTMFMFIIIAAVCGSICLLLILCCIFVICCRTRPQTQSSDHDINIHMEYYKNVRVDSEIKHDMVVIQPEMDFVQNNFNDPIYYNDGFYGEVENDIYCKDDGWRPPVSSPHTTTL